MISEDYFITLVIRVTRTRWALQAPEMESDLGQLMLHTNPKQVATQIQADSDEYHRLWAYLTNVACAMSRLLAILEWTALARVTDKYVIIPLDEGEIKLCFENFAKLSRSVFKESHFVIENHPQLRMGTADEVQFRMLNAAVNWAHLNPECPPDMMKGLCSELVSDHGEFFLTIMELYYETNQTLAHMQALSPYQ